MAFFVSALGLSKAAVGALTQSLGNTKTQNAENHKAVAAGLSFPSEVGICQASGPCKKIALLGTEILKKMRVENQDIHVTNRGEAIYVIEHLYSGNIFVRIENEKDAKIFAESFDMSTSTLYIKAGNRKTVLTTPSQYFEKKKQRDEMIAWERSRGICGGI